MEDVIVIGAGPSGLMAAIQASHEGAGVTVLERNDKPLKKLYATGNGRCNFSNIFMDDKVYRGGDPDFAARVVDDFDRNDLLLFFHNLGMMTKHIGDYIYPYNEQARTVADALLLECRRQNIKIKCNEQVVDITKPVSSDEKDGGFKIKTASRVYEARRVILAVGGKASPAHGSDGNLNDVIKGLGISFIDQRCALVPLTYDPKTYSKLAGVRVKCGVSLWVDDKELSSERGEIIFNKDNISGIPVMQMSRYATGQFDKGKDVFIYVDLFPDESEDELYSLVYSAFKGYRYCYAGDEGKGSLQADIRRDRTALEALSQMLNEKISDFCLKLAGIASDNLSFDLSDKKLIRLTELLKGIRVGIKGDAGWDRAQVSAGGVDTGDLSDELESKTIPGLYIVGELCDIDGTCGGYNLQWAFSSGAIAGRAAGKV